MTVGQSTVSVTGTIAITTGRRETEIAITQSIDNLEMKGPLELTLAPAAGGVPSVTSLPLTLSAGVNEILFLYLYSPRKVVVRATGKDTSMPGPIEFGLKGYWMQTFAPGEGITAISVLNEAIEGSVTLEYGYAALADASDTPSFWEDSK